MMLQLRKFVWNLKFRSLILVKKERKNLKTTEEVVEIALPIVQFYLNNYQGNAYIDNRKIGGTIVEVDFSKERINIPDTPERINLVNLAYINLLDRVNEFETL